GSGGASAPGLSRFSRSSSRSPSSSSVFRKRAARGPSRMLARLAFPMLENLLRQLPVGLRRDPVGLVLEDGHALHRRLGEAHGLADARGEHAVPKIFLEDLDRL